MREWLRGVWIILYFRYRLWWWLYIEGHSPFELEQILRELGAKVIQQDRRSVTYQLNKAKFKITDLTR